MYLRQLGENEVRIKEDESTWSILARVSGKRIASLHVTPIGWTSIILFIQRLHLDLLNIALIRILKKKSSFTLWWAISLQLTYVFVTILKGTLANYAEKKIIRIIFHRFSCKLTQCYMICSVHSINCVLLRGNVLVVII